MRHGSRFLPAAGRAIMFLLALLSIGQGCRKTPEDPAAQELRTAVRKYNRAVMTSYASQSVDGLAAAATAKEVGKIDALIMTLRVQNKVLISSLDSLRFTDARTLTATTAVVSTRESWTYHHTDLAGRRAGPDKTERYILIYTLLKQPDGWKVDSVDVPPGRP